MQAAILKLAHSALLMAAFAVAASPATLAQQTATGPHGGTAKASGTATDNANGSTTVSGTATGPRGQSKSGSVTGTPTSPTSTAPGQPKPAPKTK